MSGVTERSGEIGFGCAASAVENYGKEEDLMKASYKVSLGGWGKKSVSALAVAIFFWLSVGQLTSSAGQTSAPATQGELLRWMVHLRGDEASMPAGAGVSDYVQWARRHKIEPKGGWHTEAVLSREGFAEGLAPVFGL